MAAYQQSPQDEGYSEDPLTVGSIVTSPDSTPPWLAGIPRSERLDYVMTIISSLSTSEVCEIVKRVRPRLYIDFFHYLPPEVCLKILCFLDPVSLINTAQASRDWMLLALDRQLWEHLYYFEGFRINKLEVENFEASLNPERKTGSLVAEEHASKKRATSQGLLSLQTDDDSEMTDVTSPWQRHSSIFGPSIARQGSVDKDEIMLDRQSPSSSHKSMSSTFGQVVFGDQMRPDRSPVAPCPSLSTLLSSLTVVDRSDGKKKLNWQYLYSQRRRLEANWEAEKYTNFQLPHPNYPEEAHAECIYTIQYSGKYLVSGSRDQTLRIWNLDTKRLVRKPLRCHTGSVLCLQFDADPDEDLIVSGSSDATIVLWRFSTGEVIQRLKKAHKESVLNVRFDKRVLVTCSKDKTIKIFNRRPIGPGEPGYAKVGPVAQVLGNYGYNPAPTSGLAVKPAYSMIGCLEGHGAAVNAVQIYGTEVVSASGDRTVKVWDWPKQSCTKTLVGHLKGIACVQYDGRRIVSGSSDNEVKVFDRNTALEVASLRAHTNLVRTVQAGFGDLPYSVEEDREEARQGDLEFFKAIENGTISQKRTKGKAPNAGSKKLEDKLVYGATLPPGGGGGRFGRIVSGSYDETIIIWRRDKEGIWKAKHRLRQEAAANAASRDEEEDSNDQAGPSRHNSIADATGNAVPSSISTAGPSPQSGTPTAPFAPGTKEYYHHLIDQTLPQGPWALRQALQDYPEMINYAYLQESIDQLPDPTRQAMGFIIAAAINVVQLTNPSIPPTPNYTTNGTVVHQVMHAAQAQLAFQANTIPSGNTPNPGGPTHNATLTPSMARVFKLQFDARRIICCSQTPVIVGWDFANADEHIIEASRFFAPIE